MQELRKTALRRRGTLGHLTKIDYLNGGWIHSAPNECSTRAFGARSSLGCLLLLLLAPPPRLGPGLQSELKLGFSPAEATPKPARKSLPGSIFGDPNTASYSSFPTSASSCTIPAAHGTLGNTAPLPPTVHIAATQLQQRLKRAS